MDRATSPNPRDHGPNGRKCRRSALRGLVAAKSRRIRFLLPGDILGSDCIERQIEAAQAVNGGAAIVEMCRSEDSLNARPLPTPPRNGRSRPAFSAILFPFRVLAQIGGFDLPLGDLYQDRYLFRLMAAGVPFEFIEGRSSLARREQPAGSAEQVVISALANLIQCLGNPRLWQHIPDVTRPLSTMGSGAAENADLYFLQVRALDFTMKTIGELSSHEAGRSPLVPLALCLIGLEWGLSAAGRSAPQRDMLRSAILKRAADVPLDVTSELSMSSLLAETNVDPVFVKAVAGVLACLDGRPRYAGLEALLRHIGAMDRADDGRQSVANRLT
jgi:hypothetical protein